MATASSFYTWRRKWPTASSGSILISELAFGMKLRMGRAAPRLRGLFQWQMCVLPASL